MITYEYSCGHELAVEDDSKVVAPAQCTLCNEGSMVYPGPNALEMWAVFSCGHHLRVPENAAKVDRFGCKTPDCKGHLNGFTVHNPYAPESGRKFDGEKPAMDLMPPLMELEVSKVLTFGAQKYDAENWRHVPDLHTRYRSAAKRHINALRRGEKYDEESGLHHAAHAVCCLMFMGEIDLEQDQAPSESLEERKINDLLKRIDEVGADRASRAHRGQ